MHVAVAIVGFRNAADIQACLAALAGSTHTDFEVVVCENGGREAFAALSEQVKPVLPGGQTVRLVDAGANLGYAGGVNVAMREAPDADAWWVLNPDTQPDPAAMAACLRRLAADDCEAVGCTIVLPDGRVQSHGGRWQWLLGRAVSIGHGSPAAERPDPATIERDQNYLNGACMMVGRRFMETVGPMREDYFLYCEEVEWFLRAGRRGVRLGFAPDAIVRHEGGTTTGSYAAFRQMPRTPVYLNERNRLLVTRDTAPLLTPIVALGAMAVILARYARRRAWRQVGYAASGWLAGLAGRRGPPAFIPPIRDGAA